MNENNFNEDDLKKVTEFLNFIANKAEFNGWKTEDTVTHFKLLANMQQVILPKIKNNILEVVKVVEADDKGSN
jgi:hypothetical protein